MFVFCITSSIKLLKNSNLLGARSNGSTSGLRDTTIVDMLSKEPFSRHLSSRASSPISGKRASTTRGFSPIFFHFVLHKVMDVFIGHDVQDSVTGQYKELILILFSTVNNYISGTQVILEFWTGHPIYPPKAAQQDCTAIFTSSIRHGHFPQIMAILLKNKIESVEARAPYVNSFTVNSKYPSLDSPCFSSLFFGTTVASRVLRS
jgi:hypothetical protein